MLLGVLQRSCSQNSKTCGSLAMCRILPRVSDFDSCWLILIVVKFSLLYFKNFSFDIVLGKFYLNLLVVVAILLGLCFLLTAP